MPKTITPDAKPANAQPASGDINGDPVSRLNCLCMAKRFVMPTYDGGRDENAPGSDPVFVVTARLRELEAIGAFVALLRWDGDLMCWWVRWYGATEPDFVMVSRFRPV